ncbi:hypothetical protein Bca4012_019885 [Brassica carinata]
MLTGSYFSRNRVYTDSVFGKKCLCLSSKVLVRGPQYQESDKEQAGWECEERGSCFRNEEKIFNGYQEREQRDQMMQPESAAENKLRRLDLGYLQLITLF